MPGYLQTILDQGWVGALIGIFGILVGIAVAYIFHRLSARDSVLAAQSSGTRIIERSYPVVQKELQISYRGVPVTCLTATVIVVWNAGRTTIEGANIISKDPLRFVWPEGTTIVDYRVVKTSRPVIDFRLLTDSDHPNELQFSFDFLDHHDGARLSVLHTGQALRPLPTGSIKGIPTGCNDWGKLLAGGSLRTQLSITMFFVVVGLLLAAGPLLQDSAPEWLRWALVDPKDSTQRFQVLFAAIFVGFVIPAVGWIPRKTYPAKLADPAGWAEFDPSVDTTDKSDTEA